MRQTLRIWINRYLGDEEAVLLTAIIALSLVVIWFLGEILAPFLVSLIVAYILQGPMRSLVRRGIPHNFAVAITYLGFLGILVGSVLFLVPVVVSEVRLIAVDFPAIISGGEQLFRQLMESGSNYASEDMLNSLFGQLNQIALVNGEKLLAYSLGQIPGLLTLTVYGALVLILVFFILKDWKGLGLGVKNFLPTHRGAMRQIWVEMDQQLSSYLRGKVVEIIIVGVVSYVVFALFGLRYALLLALLVGLSVLVPFVGAFAVTIPVSLVALFQWGLQPITLYLVLAYVVLQILDGNVLVPVLFSEAVNLHPVMIILAILVFGGIWGIWGIFFAIPLATLIKALILAWPVSITEQQEPVDDTES